MQSKHPAGRLPDPPSPIADDGDGDEARFCGTCAFSSACIAAGYHKPELAELQCLVEHVGPFRAGEHIFRTGDPFRAIFAVRGGTVKTRMVDKEGREQVLGFYLPGEVIGLNAIYPEHFPCDAVALDHVLLPLLVPGNECAGLAHPGRAAAPVPHAQQGAGHRQPAGR